MTITTQSKRLKYVVFALYNVKFSTLQAFLISTLTLSFTDLSQKVVFQLQLSPVLLRDLETMLEVFVQHVRIQQSHVFGVGHESWGVMGSTWVEVRLSALQRGGFALLFPRNVPNCVIPAQTRPNAYL